MNELFAFISYLPALSVFAKQTTIVKQMLL